MIIRIEKTAKGFLLTAEKLINGRVFVFGEICPGSVTQIYYDDFIVLAGLAFSRAEAAENE